MISLKAFQKVFAELEKKLEDTKDSLPRNHEGNFQIKDVLNLSIQLWGNKLDLNSEQISSIQRFANASKTDAIVKDIYNEWSYLEESWGPWKSAKKNKFGNYVQEKVKSIMNLDLTGFTFILLAAFVFTGIGLILYLLNQRNSEKDNYVPKEYPPVVSSPPKILVLGINAKHQSIIQSLNKGRVAPSEVEELYRATEALWIGSQTDFSQSALKKKFSGENALQETEESEYDIYFVKIELTQPVPGFGADVNQMGRLDAFRELPKVSGKVEVSPRLSSSAYENTPVYSR
ncbi:hypothetical protein [Nostoc parmelioides]|uniref:Uncharacterized protein n=1 Tax=Nostoc parmelioides FACHB-3921 TaxID=2692909 RepID=A0ABR8BLF6_9NOSO|nr:hypothetical protein [Nostoc parmelioides]MBD2254938.1 hypothetical protein [Nostoc parmelioides FACHB-3921]